MWICWSKHRAKHTFLDFFYKNPPESILPHSGKGSPLSSNCIVCNKCFLFVFICIFGPLKIVFNKKAYWVRYIFVLHTNWIFVHTDRSAKLYLMRIFLKPLNSHDCLVYVSNPPRMCCKCMFYLGISNRLIDIPITDVLQNRILRSRIKVVQSGHLFASSRPRYTDNRWLFDICQGCARHTVPSIFMPLLPYYCTFLGW